MSATSQARTSTASLTWGAAAVGLSAALAVTLVSAVDTSPHRDIAALAIANAALTAAAGVRLLRAGVSILLLTTAVFFFAYTVRPLLAVTDGLFLQYGSYGGDVDAAYTVSMLLGVTAHALWLAGYAAGTRAPWRFRDDPVDPRRARLVLWLCLGFSGSVLGLFLALAGPTFFATGRTSAVTEVIPGGKYLFGLVLAPLIFVPGLAYLATRGLPAVRARTQLAVFVVGSLLALSALYQRGYVILALAGLVAVVQNQRQRGRVGTVVVAGVLSLALLTTMRPMIDSLTGGGHGAAQGEPRGIRQALLYSPNFDYVDVGVRAAQRVEAQGLVGPEALLAIPTRFLPASVRVDEVRQTFGQVLNLENDPVGARRGFGFIVPAWIELYGILGWSGVLLMAGPGLLSGRLDAGVALARGGGQVTYLAALFLNGFVGPPDGVLQLAVALVAVGLTLRILSRSKGVTA